jgi:hypothetical protein
LTVVDRPCQPLLVFNRHRAAALKVHKFLRPVRALTQSSASATLRLPYPDFAVTFDEIRGVKINISLTRRINIARYREINTKYQTRRRGPAFDAYITMISSAKLKPSRGDSRVKRKFMNFTILPGNCCGISAGIPKT